jgi:hypothetical protein
MTSVNRPFKIDGKDECAPVEFYLEIDDSGVNLWFKSPDVHDPCVICSVHYDGMRLYTDPEMKKAGFKLHTDNTILIKDKF